MSAAGRLCGEVMARAGIINDPGGHNNNMKSQLTRVVL